MKRVRLTLELDSEFIKLLQLNCQMQGLTGNEPKRMDTIHALAILVLGEARGATEAQIRAKTPIEWRPHIEAIHSERKVTET